MVCLGDPRRVGSSPREGGRIPKYPKIGGRVPKVGTWSDVVCGSLAPPPPPAVHQLEDGFPVGVLSSPAQELFRRGKLTCPRNCNQGEAGHRAPGQDQLLEIAHRIAR